MQENINRAKRVAPRLEKRHFHQIREYDKLWFGIANKLGFTNATIALISKKKIALTLLMTAVAYFAGLALGNWLFTAMIIFGLVILRTVHHFEFCDFDDLKQQYQNQILQTEIKNGWSLRGLKARGKWYLIIFMVIFALSAGQFFIADIQLEVINIIKMVVLIALGSFVAAMVVSLLVEYTIGGLHLNRKINYILIALLLLYTFGKYVLLFFE